MENEESVFKYGIYVTNTNNPRENIGLVAKVIDYVEAQVMASALYISSVPLSYSVKRLIDKTPEKTDENLKAIEKINGRINEVQKRLEREKVDCRELGMYSDCGSFYRDEVKKTEAIIEELIMLKKLFEK
jgi:hypothetical protein